MQGSLLPQTSRCGEYLESGRVCIAGLLCIQKGDDKGRLPG